MCKKQYTFGILFFFVLCISFKRCILRLSREGLRPEGTTFYSIGCKPYVGNVWVASSETQNFASLQ